MNKEREKISKALGAAVPRKKRDFYAEYEAAMNERGFYKIFTGKVGNRQTYTWGRKK